jgi:hypothetical protein
LPALTTASVSQVDAPELVVVRDEQNRSTAFDIPANLAANGRTNALCGLQGDDWLWFCRRNGPANFFLKYRGVKQWGFVGAYWCNRKT